ncbi:hypothetical protein [uncultured Citricoccus sp.]|uniref:hypothetical protein n=1 Tax=uncultured Citricoccus sp. TaxID=614031 RepID=UPI00261B7FCD|nr:hypothetical protein [uncultured Citricoccus sp.]
MITEPTRCPQCRTLTLNQWDATPLSPIGEALAWLDGRPTATATPDGTGVDLTPRDADAIATAPAGSCDTLPAHSCGTGMLPTAPTIHAPAISPTKALMEATFGHGYGWRAATATRCRCKAWTLAGPDADIGAFTRVVDPVDLSGYGQALAVASGREIIRCAWHGKGVRLFHPWDALPYGIREFHRFAEHECGRLLPGVFPETLNPAVRYSPELLGDCPY